MQRILCTSLLLLFFIAAQAQEVDTVQQIDLLFSHWNNDTPGGAVLVKRGENILYNKAFGMADLEHNVPNRTTSIFECGSVSKQFTATAALLLVKEGKLKLDDDVRKFIPELPVYDAPIRVQHLLNHTSGLKDWGSVGGLSGWPRTTRVYTQELALQIICRQKTLNFTPGAEYSYSNSNYSLLVTLVERISGQSLSAFTDERLFRPAGMTDTQWRDNFREVIPGRSVAYEKRGGSYEQVMPFENVHGHGGLLTTTADLTRWNEQLISHSIGGDDVYGMRIRQGPLNNGTTIQYASGIVVNRRHATLEISHSGATAAYRAYLVSYPEKKLSIAILSNDGRFNAPAAGNAIADILLGKDATARMPDRPAVSLQAERVRQWNGIYKSIRGFDVVTVDIRDGGPVINNQAVRAIHTDTLLLNNTQWISNRAGWMLAQTGSDTASYVRMKPAAIALQPYTGNYQSSEANCSFGIELKEDKLYLVNAPFPPMELKPRFLDGFQVDGWDLVEFRKNAKGIVIGFDYSTSRAERIPFTRVNK
jgi:CubicO group peptidase (beta-lactamase class C family)